MEAFRIVATRRVRGYRSICNWVDRIVYFKMRGQVGVRCGWLKLERVYVTLICSSLGGGALTDAADLSLVLRRDF